MLEETTGRAERRATQVVLIVLAIEAIWVFLHKYLPLDGALWSLQAELVNRHMSGTVQDGWKLIPYPASNIFVPLIDSFLTIFVSGEVATRLLHAFVGILLRGVAYIVLFRAMRVRDDAVYYLIPVIVWGGLWFTGSLPYVFAESIAIFAIAFLVSQSHPRSGAFWVMSALLAVTALCHALAFLLAVVVVFLIAVEQRRSVHLSQGWLSNGRAVLGLLLPGAVVLLLSFFRGDNVFHFTDSGLLPQNPWGLLFFSFTPSPDVQEATFRGGEFLHGILSLALATVVVGCFLRAFFLAIEEVTWRSRALKQGGLFLLVLAVAAPLLMRIGFQSPAWIGAALLILLAGSYSRGPAARRTPLDRLLVALSLTLMIVSGVVNAFSVNRGSEAARESIRQAAELAQGERQFAAQEEGLPRISVRFAIDSAFAQTRGTWLVGSFSYAMAAPIYLYLERSLLANPAAFQPAGGAVRSSSPTASRSPVAQIVYNAPEDYVRPERRVLALLPIGTTRSDSFGPFGYSIVDTTGSRFSWGEAEFQLLIGKLSAKPASGMALLHNSK